MTGDDWQPTADERADMAWWNSLTEAERAYWLRTADTATPAEAWASAAFQPDQMQRIATHYAQV